MSPHYKNFRGNIETISHQKFISVGRVSVLDNNKLEISELPVGTWTQNYKENVLEVLLHGSDKDKATNQKGILTDYKEYNTDTTVRFVVTFAAGEFEKLYSEDGGFHRVFKLTSSLNTSCMHAFDFANYLRRYDTASDLLKEFYGLRLEYYEKRKVYLEGQLGAEAELMTMKARFIMEKCDRSLVVENKKRKVMIDELIKRGYTPDPVKEWKRRVAINAEEDDDKPDGKLKKNVCFFLKTNLRYFCF
jgi:DNA topoisomerase II